jgi:hypothetical protein
MQLYSPKRPEIRIPTSGQDLSALVESPVQAACVLGSGAFRFE